VAQLSLTALFQKYDAQGKPQRQRKAVVTADDAVWPDGATGNELGESGKAKGFLGANPKKRSIHLRYFPSILRSIPLYY
jgi:hypothetical protein